MRLLKHDGAGRLSLTRNLTGNDIPEYAILSHTWGTETEEVDYHDLIAGTGKNKSGYQKIRFCREQARRDGLQYFWVDTCCIDKTSSSELSEAIVSMFRWYQRAARCYVYLSDVSRPTFNDNDKLVGELAKSRWFTRGWTLQELLAPEFLVFFSKHWEVLGNKKSLEQPISEITGISVRALQRNSLSDFTVDERLFWARKRETTRAEDNAYSLLGIFNVSMPVLYGEGKEKAFERLHWEIHKPRIELNQLSFITNSPSNSNRKTSRNTARARRGTMTHSGNSSKGSEIRCYRCDYRHYLNECFANEDTVSKVRDTRKISGRCIKLRERRSLDKGL